MGGGILIKKLDDNMLEKVNGGSLEWVGVGLLVTALVVFLSGVLEGFTNPGRCSNWIR